MNKKIAVFLIVVALSAGTIVFLNGAGKNKAENGDKEVIVKAVSKGELLQTVSAEGDVEITNEEDIYISKSIRVDEVFFEENDSVKKGEKLITFDPEQRNELMRLIKAAELKIKSEELSIQEYEFPISTLAIKSAEREIEEINIEIEKYKEKIKVAAFEKKTLEIEHENNIEEYEINKKLFDLEGISFTELNTSEEAKNSSAKNIELKEWDINEYKLEIANLNGKLLFEQNSLAEAEQTYEESVTTRENNISRSKIAIEEYELEIESLTESLEKTLEYVISPVDGTITEVNAEENFLVDTTESLMTISDINSQVITANISSYDINKVKIGQKVRISSDSFEENEYLEGEVESISSLATTQTGSGYQDVVVEVEVSFNSENSDLRPGYSVDLEIIIESKDNAVTVPSFAINKNKRGDNYVMILNNDSTVSQRIVQTGLETTTQVEVLNLSGNERIVMNALDLRDGEKVKVVDKMTSVVGEEPERDQGGGPDGGGGGGSRP